MNQLPLPKSTLPPLLIVSEKDSFAYFTFTQRLPVIIDRIIAENNFNTTIIETLKILAQDIVNGSIRLIKDDGGADVKDWEIYLQPYLNKPWLDTPFYFAEAYFYRRIIEATQYFLLGIDPFELQKRLGLETVIDSIRTASQYVAISEDIYTDRGRGTRWQQILINLIYLNLWGNRADLSLKPTEAGNFQQEEIENNPDNQHILIDDTALIIDKISHFKGNRIDFIVDNSGLELVSDLLLIDFLLTGNVAEKIYIHLKSHPTVVSDATLKDVNFTLEFLANDSDKNVHNLALRLQKYITLERLQLVDHFFWTSPLFFWEMPDSLNQDLAKSDLVFIKGDANYRRLIGDYHWEKTNSFNNIVSYFPAAFAALRTLKSEVIVGLTENQINELNLQDSHWLTNGKWGVIQLINKPPRLTSLKNAKNSSYF